MEPLEEPALPPLEAPQASWSPLLPLPPLEEPPLLPLPLPLPDFAEPGACQSTSTSGGAVHLVGGFVGGAFHSWTGDLVGPFVGGACHSLCDVCTDERQSSSTGDFVGGACHARTGDFVGGACHAWTGDFVGGACQARTGDLEGGLVGGACQACSSSSRASSQSSCLRRHAVPLIQDRPWLTRAKTLG